MLILFDQGTPRGIARWLLDHTVKEAKSQGWDRLTNGELLNAAEQAGFDLLLTTDKNLRYQQNVEARRIAIVVFRQRQVEAHSATDIESGGSGERCPARNLHRSGYTRLS